MSSNVCAYFTFEVDPFLISRTSHVWLQISFVMAQLLPYSVCLFSIEWEVKN